MRTFTEFDPVKQKRGLVLLCSMLAWCVGLVFFRVERTGSVYFLFLIWNLFLACIPLFASRLLRLAHERRIPDVAQLGLLAVWLLFLPNAPYILTDLIHLRPGSTRLYWYDLAMLLSFAGVGLLLGYLSLFDVHKIFEERFGHRVAWSVAAATLLLCGYGIYLGRAMRWNSWDVVANPRELFDFIADCLLNPTAHLRMYAISGIFGTGLLLGYVMLHLMISNRRSLAAD